MDADNVATELFRGCLLQFGPELFVLMSDIKEY